MSVYHTRWRLHAVSLIAERQERKQWKPIFIVFSLTRSGIKPEFTASVADALSTTDQKHYNVYGSVTKILHVKKLNFFIVVQILQQL